MKRKFKIDWIQIILGIILIVLGSFLFNNPFKTWVGLGYLVGVIAIVRGISVILTAWELRHYPLLRPAAILHIIFGIFLVVFGFYLFANQELAISTVGVLLGIWVIGEGAQALFLAGWARWLPGPFFIFQSIFAVFLIIGGFRLMFSPTAGLAAATIFAFTVIVDGVSKVFSGLVGHPEPRQVEEYPQGPWSKNIKDVGGDEQ